MLVQDFDFELPPELIAQQRVMPPSTAKLLHVHGGLSDLKIGDLPNILKSDDLLVCNDTKVIPARLTGTRSTGGVTEITLHRMMTDNCWRAFVRPAKRLKVGEVLDLGKDFSATILQKLDDGEIELQFNYSGFDLFKAFDDFGRMPLPPYIKRGQNGDDRDRQAYQTLFADEQGAVAAPTAGLHFDDELLARLKGKGIGLAKVTLHVGAGTFLPVKVDDTKDHIMHFEWARIDQATADLINKTKKQGGRIVCVGTTSLRVLETVADKKTGRVAAFSGETDLFITPGYRFRCVDVLMTNFHLPKSTLFMLVSAFAGLKVMKNAYQHATENGYRFYSYGDACLLEKPEIMP